MERANGPQIRKKRRSNYQRLALAVAAQPYLQALWPRLSDGVCPLGLPIRCSEREGARRHFLDRGINVRAYWERLPREVSTHEHPAAHQLSQEILILPVHQSMTQRQIEHVVRAIEELPGGVAA
jgi:dTDP-4-amino-4,6-dideoxygalactose transaminase